MALRHRLVNAKFHLHRCNGRLARRKLGQIDLPPSSVNRGNCPTLSGVDLAGIRGTHERIQKAGLEVGCMERVFLIAVINRPDRSSYTGYKHF